MLFFYIVAAILAAVIFFMFASERQDEKDLKKEQENNLEHLKVCKGCKEKRHVHFFAKVDDAKTLSDIKECWKVADKNPF